MVVSVYKDSVCLHLGQMILSHLGAGFVVHLVVAALVVHPTSSRACFVRRQIEVHRNQRRLGHSRYRQVVRLVGGLLDLEATSRGMVDPFQYSMHGARGKDGCRLQYRHLAQSCPVVVTAKRHSERLSW